MNFNSVLVPNTNLRLIAIDTQTGNIDNVWLLSNATDPQGVLSWLYRELLSAEKKGEKVYIFGHIPFGHSDTIAAYARRTNVLIDRFEYTIAGLFFGHLHTDEWLVNRGVFSNLPTRVQWISPSLTTWKGHNPAFRIFTADSNTKEIVDFDQYRLNLAQANLYPNFPPVFAKSYTFSKYYGIKDLKTETIFKLATLAGTDENIAIKYNNNIQNGTAPATTCDATCRHFLQCRLSYGVFDDAANCVGFPYGYLTKVLDYLFGQDWVYKQ